MNKYQPVELDGGLWAIERFVDGASHGFTLGRYQDKAAASYFANVFARMEMSEEPEPPNQPQPPDMRRGRRPRVE